MIVEQDFCDHWKTQMLVNLLGDNAAPVYVLRLWAHCQNRKAWEFDLTPDALKAVCRWPGDPAVLWSAMLTTGFTENGNGMLTVHDWENVNSKLVANWTNGARGGRPRGTGKNPTKTHAEPTRNPRGTDREDREDREDNPPVVPHSTHTAIKEPDWDAIGIPALVKQVQTCRPEYAQLRSVAVENTIKNCPVGIARTVIREWTTSQVNALKSMDMPLASLKKRLALACGEGTPPPRKRTGLSLRAMYDEEQALRAAAETKGGTDE